jgi:hypothetical protein
VFISILEPVLQNNKISTLEISGERKIRNTACFPAVIYFRVDLVLADIEELRTGKKISGILYTNLRK